MSTLPNDAESHEDPGPRTIRFWLGLLVVIMLIVQVGSVTWAWSEWYHADLTDSKAMHFYTHWFVVALVTALLAMLFIVGGAGLILNFSWAWRIIFLGAILQILATVCLQLWEATLVESLIEEAGKHPPGRGWMTAIIGVVAWNIVPVGILVLAAAGRKYAAMHRA